MTLRPHRCHLPLQRAVRCPVTSPAFARELSVDESFFGNVSRVRRTRIATLGGQACLVDVACYVARFFCCALAHSSVMRFAIRPKSSCACVETIASVVPKAQGVRQRMRQRKRPPEGGLCLDSIRGVPKGIRTPVTAVKGRCPGPLDDGDASKARDFRPNLVEPAGIEPATSTMPL